MTDFEVMQARHSVRSYTARPIEADKVAELEKAISEVNAQYGMHIQLFTEEPQAFAGTFHCRNYFAVVGPKGANELAGYCGEALVLEAQKLGLNTCWVGMSYNRAKVREVADSGEKLLIVIGLGYGDTQGSSRRSKSPEAVSNITATSPQWFKDGVRAALLAPTGLNRQNFQLTLKGDKVSLKSGFGFGSDIDLGIVKYHFELGAGKQNFSWE